MGLVEVLDMEEEGALDFTMGYSVTVAKDMVGQIFLVNWEVVRRFQISHVETSLEGG